MLIASPLASSRCGFPTLPQLLELLSQSGEFRAGDLKAEVNGWESSLLLVAGADSCSFVIREQRKVDCPWPMAFLELRGAAHIHQRPLALPQLFD